MLYQISNGAVAFGDDVILHSIDFEIRNTEIVTVFHVFQCDTYVTATTGHTRC